MITLIKKNLFPFVLKTFVQDLDRNQSDSRRPKLKSCKRSLVEQTTDNGRLRPLSFLIQHRGHNPLFKYGL